MPLGKIKEDKTKMDKVKNMIVKLISRALSMEEFEAWLYNDEYVNNHILDDEGILELLSINLKSKYARAELEKYLYAKFGEEVCLIEQVKVNCEVLVSSDLMQKDFESFLHSLYRLHDWDKDYRLISQAYWFDDEWSLAMDGYSDRNRLEKEVLAYAKEVLQKLSKADKDEMLEILNEGVEIKLTTEVTPALNESKSPNNVSLAESKERTRKWFEFWK